MNIEDCFKKRLLRKILPDENKSKKSIILAEKSLENAKKLLKTKIYDVVLIKAYLTIFHSARAVLYKDGIQEKSHYATMIYLKEKHKNVFDQSLIAAFDVHRVERHESLYGVDFDYSIEDCFTAIEDAEKFLKVTKNFIKNK